MIGAGLAAPSVMKELNSEVQKILDMPRL